MTTPVRPGSDRAAGGDAPAMSRPRRAIVDGLGTAFLLATIVGSGVTGERLSGGNAAVTLLVNSMATGLGLIGIILGCRMVSGAHLNPVVTLTEAWRGTFSWRDVPAYVAAQLVGALAGVAVSHAMFGMPAFSIATTGRGGPERILAEFVATAGVVLVIVGSSRVGPVGSAVAIGCYVAAAYWFTSSTAFANPAVTLARALSDTVVGTRPRNVPGFLLGQGAAAAGVAAVLRWPGPAAFRRRT
jgi:glycerol uptake facilitator-like aquaporin